MACGPARNTTPEADADLPEATRDTGHLTVDMAPPSDTSEPPDALTDTGLEASRDGGVEDTSLDANPTDLGGDPMWRDPYGFLTLNLHCLRVDGTSFRTNEDRFRAVAAAVAAENVRVIAVQEACQRDAKSAMSLLESALRTATGATWSSTWTAAHTAWEGTPDQALEGLGILVRGAIDPASVHRYSYRTQSGLTRVMVGARLPPELGGAMVYSVHLSYESPAAREEQARETASVALSAAHPSRDVLIAGDFNAMPGSPSHRALTQWGYRDLTATLSSARIDHVWASAGAALSGSGEAAVFNGLRHPVVSDHHGYLVRLSPSAAPSVGHTTLVARADVGEGHALTVRGGTAPLAWDRGWTAHRADANTWRLVCPALPATRFEYKWLVDDTRWQSGANASATGGAEASLTPTF